MAETLIIENIDLDLLEKQRLELIELYCGGIRPSQCRELPGLINMLDTWSDKRAENDNADNKK